MAESIIAPDWKPTMKAPSGYYQSPMYPDLFFKKRDQSELPSDAAVRYMTRQQIDDAIPDEEYAIDGKALSSEDAQRYGLAVSNGTLRDYFDWRSLAGLVWWEEEERRYGSPANDNKSQTEKVAA